MNTAGCSRCACLLALCLSAGFVPVCRVSAVLFFFCIACLLARVYFVLAIRVFVVFYAQHLCVDNVLCCLS